MDLLSNEDLELLRLYQKFSYKAINSLLTVDSEVELAKVLDKVDDDTNTNELFTNYTKVNVIKSMSTVKNIYSLMNKLYREKLAKDWSFARGTNMEELDTIKNEMYIDKVIAASSDMSVVEKDASENPIPVILNILGDKEIPYIDVNGALNNNYNKKEILISPFTEVEKLESVEDKALSNGKIARVYNLHIKKQKFEKLDGEKSSDIYTEILTNADKIGELFARCVEIEHENSKNYEDIRRLEQLLTKSETELEEKESSGADEKEILDEEDNIDRINKQLDSLKELANDLFEEKKENLEFIATWKKSVMEYLMSECYDIDEEYSIKTQVKEEREKEKKAKLKTKIKEKEEELQNQNLNEIIEIVRKECKENIVMTERLVSDSKNLIQKQQNHAKIAESLGTDYSALNNGFDIKKQAEELNDLVHTISLKVEELVETLDKLILDERLLEISKVNIQISTLINYFNNPRSSVGKAKVTRFDEMEIVEENELKRGIARKIISICGESELKKLSNDIEIIEDKNAIQKIIDFITGRGKIDEYMLEQIEVRQKAIRKTLARKLELSTNYSIHELIAYIKMFINDNEEDELVEEDCKELSDLEIKLRKNFIISYSKIDEIVAKKEGKNLPVDYKKISKKEFIEIETYRFLNKYGYDIEKEAVEPEYQDTAVSELNRIIEYITTSGIL